MNWIAKYEQKTGQKFTPRPMEELLYDTDKGFCTYEIDKDILYIGGVCGDGKYWDNLIRKIAKEFNCKKIMFGTYRKKPTAFTRKFGYKVVGFILEKEV